MPRRPPRSASFTAGTVALKSGGTPNRLTPMDKPKRSLVIQLKRAGDVIVTLPVLPVLKAALPGTEIDFLVDKAFAPLIENHPSVSAVRVYDRKSMWTTWKTLRAASYDWIIDFQSSPRSIL